ncbi:MAG: replication factor C large subunit [Candidatus Bilamarchaeaceae archaeon]
MVELLTDKYAPKSIDEMVGNEEKREAVKRWILRWSSGQKPRPLLIYGPSGVGKTSTAYALVHQYDLELIEMNASELRDKERVERIVHSAATTKTLSGKMRMILIDDVDIFIGKNDSGGLPAIVRIIKEANCPILLTATNIWDKKLALLRAECELVEMKKVSRASIKTLLSKIAKNEKLGISEEKIEAIAENSGGDVRSALIDLQGMWISARDREEDLFIRVKTIFKATTYKEAKEALAGDADYELLKLWIDENIPNEYENIEDLVRAYHWLSRADVFQGRIKKSSWVLLKYALDLMSAGIALAKAERYKKFTKYIFPKYLKAMSISMERRAMMKSLGLKIGRIVHTNYRHAPDYFTLLSGLPPKILEDFYGLNEDEIKFLRSISR